jgi:glycosyltransferase involved in cell wall biosynthesis
MSLGISVVICSHNGAQRLPQTLAHLATQQVAPEITWEVILVDNASTDDTALIAKQSWPLGDTVPLRVLSEPRLGVAYARFLGLNEARYDYIGFVDDDNWMAPNWVEVAIKIMSQHPEIGACGSYSEPVFETTPPWWFDQFKELFAIGANGESGDVTHTRGVLWGAGMVIRKAAWQQLADNGFHFLLAGQQGQTLTKGEDTELCLALRVAGWKIWYDQHLQFRHFLVAHRMNWNYMRRLQRGGGISTIGHDPYYFALKPKRKGLLKLVRELRETWQWQILMALKILFRRPDKLVSALFFPSEGSRDALDIEANLGRVQGLLQKRKTYRSNKLKIRHAVWRQVSTS